MATTRGKYVRPFTRAEQKQANEVMRFEALLRALEYFDGHELDRNLTRALKVIGQQHPRDYAGRSQLVTMALRGSP